ncbi:DTW domain-containing protein 1 [Exaiptasia diaphana]|uniref:tRNA-uridine aminocarboxypropyltransferase 1 n=1 Tax=Exaiptasia diaphana TaxID=2652724 RepID=A0A913WWF9_EXADI|nr:DTW domain-containing protein 1 [Exaiptasia diaphana]
MADEVENLDEQRKLEENPFASLKISSFEVLRDAERSTCKKCKASRKYYCYKCFDVVGIERSMIPFVSLPLQVDIIKHKGEVMGKSTACHAAILAPDNVTIHHFPTIPQFKSKEKVILVYPSETALSLGDLEKKTSSNDCTHFDHVIFIDSTWDQTHSIISDPRLADIQRVKLENATTYFWRPQRKPSTCLATIEAVYYFFKEYQKYIMKSDYDGQFDNLLYFFVFQYLLIKQKKRKSKRQKLE